MVYKEIHNMSFHLMQTSVFPKGEKRVVVSKIVYDSRFSHMLEILHVRAKDTEFFSPVGCFCHLSLWKMGFLLGAFVILSC